MSRLARRLTTFDATVIGVGSMVGAGIFAAVSPAATAAGTWVLAGLAIAAAVAFANATSSAQLAALYPESGGTYVYARRRLGTYWSFLAGWAFVVGKIASLSVMALTFGSYVHAPTARPLGVAAVVALTIVNVGGIRKTARTTLVIVVLVLVALAAVVVASLDGASSANLSSEAPSGPLGVLRSAGLLFFAFAGYARVATLGEEVVSPRTAIPRAIVASLAIVVVVYAIVIASALAAVGPDVLARSPAPLTAAAGAGWAGVVRAGAAIASLGVMLSLLAGVSRTVLSMARERDLPGLLDRVHVRFRTPYLADIAVAAVVCTLVTFADLADALGASSFAVLGYYALTGASAWTLGAEQRLWPRWLSGAAVVSCVVLAFSLPPVSVVGGLIVLGAGSLVWLGRQHRLR